MRFGAIVTSLLEVDGGRLVLLNVLFLPSAFVLLVSNPALLSQNSRQFKAL